MGKIISKISIFISLAIVLALVLPLPAMSQDPEISVGSGQARVSIPQGYSLRLLVTGLDFPTAITFADNRIWVSEAGISSSGGTGMTQDITVPKVKEIDSNGNVKEILSAGDLPSGKLIAPITDITYHDGWLWITHRQKGANGWNVGAISRFRPDSPAATFTTVITNLPSAGDHFTNEVLFGSDGRIYFSQGSATNSGVVGPDNEIIMKWLGLAPGFRDFPPVDVVLSGIEYTAFNPLTSDPGDSAVTVPYHPFNSGAIPEGLVVGGVSPVCPQDGIIAGNGSVYSFDPANPSGTMRLEGWGLRNPYGIAFDPYSPGKLFVTNNGADVRIMSGAVVETRPIANDYDDLFVLDAGGDIEFFGFPDYFHSPQTGAVMPVTDPFFSTGMPSISSPQFIFDEGFRNVLKTLPAFAQLEYHSSVNKLDISSSQVFGFAGDIFIAESGAMVPVTGAQAFTGYKVVHVDRSNGSVSDFVANAGTTPEAMFDPEGFNKPTDVKFSGDTMYIVDFGVFEPGLDLVKPETGKIWTLSRSQAQSTTVTPTAILPSTTVPLATTSPPTTIPPTTVYIPDTPPTTTVYLIIVPPTVTYTPAVVAPTTCPPTTTTCPPLTTVPPTVTCPPSITVPQTTCPPTTSPPTTTPLASTSPVKKEVTEPRDDDKPLKTGDKAVSVTQPKKDDEPLKKTDTDDKKADKDIKVDRDDKKSGEDNKKARGEDKKIEDREDKKDDKKVDKEDRSKDDKDSKETAASKKDDKPAAKDTRVDSNASSKKEESKSSVKDDRTSKKK